MKINEKNLCYFATSPPIDREGWLQKRGEVNKSWQRRYFVLKGNLLFYFDKKGDKEPIGVIILEGCTIELAEDGENYCFQIVFHGINNRTYHLSAESQEIMEKWMKALTTAGYEYMKLMVADLQRQLDEKDSVSQALTEVPKPPPRRYNPFNNNNNNNRNVPDRPAPAPPTHPSSYTKNPASNQQAINNGGGGLPKTLPSNNNSQQSLSNNQLHQKDEWSSLSKAPMNDKSTAKTNEFTFQMVHEAFGREIMQDLKERKRLKELAHQPLINFDNN